MHKDLSDSKRERLEEEARVFLRLTCDNNLTLASACEAWINAFDAAAKELDAG